MPAYIDQPIDDFHCLVHVSNLPPDVVAKQITNIFGQFGNIVKLHLKRRVSKDSNVRLPHPYVILVFENKENVDNVMANRPYAMNDQPLFVRRCLPLTRRYPYEAHFSSYLLLIRVPKENNNDVLPDNKIIADYLKPAGGSILRLNRVDERTVLVEFDDYDPVDICCLSRPHFINNQMVEVEKCRSERQVRARTQFQQQSRPLLLEPSPTPSKADVENSSCDAISPVLTWNIDEQVAQLQSTHSALIDGLENEHGQHVASLKAELEQIMKDRIRLQRLTLDCKHEQKRFIEENQRWHELNNEYLKEYSDIQNQEKQK